MSEFNNVTIIREANVYFDGKCVSRTVKFQDGTRKTLGFLQNGDYTFSTGAAETMEIQCGELTVELPGSTEIMTINGTGVFVVPANSSFTMHVTTPVDYCCSYAE